MLTVLVKFCIIILWTLIVQEGKMLMFTLLVSALKPGMILWDDVYSLSNEILLRANCVLDDQKIELLQENQISEVDLKSADDIGTTQFERINRNSDFKRFSSVHEDGVAMCKRLVKNLAANLPVKLSSFNVITDSILETVRTNGQLLDFLTNMLSNEYEMTYTHCVNSALLCHIFGTWLNYPQETIDSLMLCGFLYDIGKTQLPEELIWKSGKLTDEERLQIRRHIHLGYDMLKDKELPPHVITTLVMHHERTDGSGYPAGLRSSKIDSYALFIAIVDSFEAMTHPRANRPALTAFQAIRNFEQEGFYKYGENTIRPILTKVAQNYLNCEVMLNNNIIGQIVEIHEDNLSRPTILCENLTFDIRMYPDVEIVRIL